MRQGSLLTHTPIPDRCQCMYRRNQGHKRKPGALILPVLRRDSKARPASPKQEAPLAYSKLHQEVGDVGRRRTREKGGGATIPGGFDQTLIAGSSTHTGRVGPACTNAWHKKACAEGEENKKKRDGPAFRYQMPCKDCHPRKQGGVHSLKINAEDLLLS